MTDTRKITKGFSTDDFEVIYESEVIDGFVLDTEVKVKDVDGYVTLCFIAGNDIKKFDEELRTLVQKYRI